MHVSADKIVEKINENFLFVLSYGNSKRLVPISVFKLADIVKSGSSPYNYGTLSDDDVMVKLIKYDCNNLGMTEKEIIYMSFDKFIKLIGTAYIRNNKAIVEDLLKKDARKTDILDAMQIVSMILSTNKDYELKVRQSKTLDQLDATYEVNGDALGTNYSIIPFYYDEEVRYLDDELKPKSKVKSNV